MFSFRFPAPIELKRSTILHSGVTVEKEYFVRFKVTATAFSGEEWSSIIRFGTGANRLNHGDRIPAVFFREKDGKRHLFVYVQSTYGDYITFTKPEIPTNVWTDVVIEQAERGGRYVIEVIVDGEVIGSMVNYDPYVFQNVKVYLSDPWNAAQPGFIKDFSFK